MIKNPKKLYRHNEFTLTVYCTTMLAGTESTADYEPAEKVQGSKPAIEVESTSLGDGGSQSSSSDSMNPYD